LPAVTPRTANSRRLAVIPVTRSTALKIASTGPSPMAASCTSWPSGRRMQTVAVGVTLVPAVVCRLTSVQCAGMSWMCFSIRMIRSSS
jgi:hypothetical protein